eukprot:jgi/Astpho2/80/Aster-04553
MSQGGTVRRWRCLSSSVPGGQRMSGSARQIGLRMMGLPLKRRSKLLTSCRSEPDSSFLAAAALSRQREAQLFCCAGLQKGADNLQRNVDKAADQAASTAESLVDRVSQGAQSAVDSVADVIESVKKNAGSDKPAPFAFQPLTVLTATPPEETPSDNKQYQKLRLLQSVAGLDRGFAANTTAAALVESAALALAGTGEAVTLSWTPVDDEQATMQQLGGTWRLIYSSGFSSGSIGGSRPGPPAGLIPFTLGQVYQVISPYTNKLDNVVELYSKIIPPTLPGFPESKRAVLTASLKHSFEAVGGSAVQITFEDTEVRATGGPLGTLGNLPEFMIPQLPEPLRPSRQARTSTFDVLYLDNDMRITRGSRGELRIFVRT